ncbi:unnamed protein product [Oppiella nova]|uniref:Uncharacterized protein n=1 Tax=Oppiella nova TaxID=334625 RepID=A0A7R9MEC2_9ACAR|nr:unnamed protein product [Oppiella nova]CAD7658632.1 unnamed protein product [Oppiella nova]CAG2175817.1 unnamed protein product [Oppiella nova]CAG2175818.1 unnamed protein product [Oppiella nova]
MTNEKTGPNRAQNKAHAIHTKIKLMTMIERMAEKRVGFSCWKLFTINYFRCYEIISLLSVLFLKIIELSRNKG